MLINLLGPSKYDPQLKSALSNNSWKKSKFVPFNPEANIPDELTDVVVL